jgi:hypothetical protein
LIGAQLLARVFSKISHNLYEGHLRAFAPNGLESGFVNLSL